MVPATDIVTSSPTTAPGNPPGKLADAEMHSAAGPLDGLELIRLRHLGAPQPGATPRSRRGSTPSTASGAASRRCDRSSTRVRGDKTLLLDPRLALFPLPVVSMLTEMAMGRAAPELDAAMTPYEATLKAIAAGGGKIIAGTDSPIVPYGLGLHVELEAYVHAGLTPFQALQTATVNAAQTLGLGDQIGTIEPGKLADLAFLGSDPLLDIRNTRDVKRVMRGGRLFTVSDLILKR